ncbi:WXG100 family type VII secretion target [Saccharopolyspora hattusasensis]|uniref:WXG100 family type VII secretion target n=1 Tax=Saccharopolyspora hattusasensis TaxID=1128679 RepID=UPI003D99FD30
MDQIAVDFRALEAGEQALRRAVDEIDIQLTELEAVVSRLLGSWSGEAAEAYQAAQEEWDQAVAGMRENVREMHQLLVTAHGNQASAVRSTPGSGRPDAGVVSHSPAAVGARTRARACNAGRCAPGGLPPGRSGIRRWAERRHECLRDAHRESPRA